MPYEVWGCYGVADHLGPRAFVADVLLYERLVIPVRPTEEPGSAAYKVWTEQGWNPDLQHKLLEILGPMANQISWNTRRRREWGEVWRTAEPADDIKWAADGGRSLPPSPSKEIVSNAAAALTRKQISLGLAEKVLKQPNVLALAVYSDITHFERDWRIRKSWPFLRRTRKQVQRGLLNEVHDAIPSGNAELANLIVFQQAIPDDRDIDDAEMLKRAVEFAQGEKASSWRRAFHQLIAQMTSQGLEESTVRREVLSLVRQYEALMRTKGWAEKVRVGSMLLGNGTGAAISLSGHAPIGKVIGSNIVGGGKVLADRIYTPDDSRYLDAAALIVEGRQVLRGE